MVAYLRRRHYTPMNRPLRACHPRDLLDQAVALCRYRGIEPMITADVLDAACATYFIDDAPGPAVPAPANVLAAEAIGDLDLSAAESL
jgi:hypothetical protein